MSPIETKGNTTTKLERIAWLSAKDPNKVFHQLMHHFNLESLLQCFHELDGKKAVGIDGVTKEQYRNNLIPNLEDLTARMKRMGYRPGPVREALVPKEGNPGVMRPLGISNLEDKIVQRMMQKILESIYEPLFLEQSFGFRPGRGCHDAIKSLHAYLFYNRVGTTIDIDLENFFGTIDHGMLTTMLRKKIADERFIRYIIRMFKSGVLSNKELKVSNEGIPQGSICSPILSNIYAHYVIDEWFEKIVKVNCAGKVEIFRYADDLVVCCENQRDAERIRKSLGKRLAKYKLKLNEEKTKEVRFSKELMRQGVKQGVFDFLGFTFYFGKSARGAIIPKLKTNGKRLNSKLKKVASWTKGVRNKYELAKIWRLFCLKLRGHIQYYAVSFNLNETNKFVHKAQRILFKWINRRSQKKSFDWTKFELFIKRHPLPKVKVCHKLF